MTEDEACCPAAEVPVVGRKDAEWIADQFHALSDPTRVQIVNLLAVRADELTVSQVGEAVGVTQATASHHLKILRQHGLVERRRAGNRVFMSVHHEAVCSLPALARSVVGC